MPQQITQKDFATKIRQKIPELKDFSDDQIVKKIMEMRPELKDVIRTPDQAAVEEQARTEKRSHSMVDPETWKNHPTIGNFIKSALGVLPATGAMIGGVAATPETLGVGTLAGGALGAGAGRGLQDISSQMLGLEDTSPVQKAKNIGLDTGITAVAPGAMTIARHPITAARMAVSDILGAEGALIPKGIRPFIQLPFLEKFARGPGPNPRITPFARYSQELENIPKNGPTGLTSINKDSIKPGSSEMEDFINQVFNRKP